MDVRRMLSELRSEREEIQQTIDFLEYFDPLYPITINAKSPVRSFRGRPSAHQPFFTGCRIVRRTRLAEGPSLVSPRVK